MRCIWGEEGPVKKIIFFLFPKLAVGKMDPDLTKKIMVGPSLIEI
jgi:hypothetical protein